MIRSRSRADGASTNAKVTEWGGEEMNREEVGMRGRGSYSRYKPNLNSSAISNNGQDVVCARKTAKQLGYPAISRSANCRFSNGMRFKRDGYLISNIPSTE